MIWWKIFSFLFLMSVGVNVMLFSYNIYSIYRCNSFSLSTKCEMCHNPLTKINYCMMFMGIIIKGRCEMFMVVWDDSKSFFCYRFSSSSSSLFVSSLLLFSLSFFFFKGKILLDFSCGSVPKAVGRKQKLGK